MPRCIQHANVLQPYCNRAGTRRYAADVPSAQQIAAHNKTPANSQIYRTGRDGVEYPGTHGAVAQSGERRLCTAEVRGSTPLGSTLGKRNPAGKFSDRIARLLAACSCSNTQGACEDNGQRLLRPLVKRHCSKSVERCPCPLYGGEGQPRMIRAAIIPPTTNQPFCYRSRRRRRKPEPP